MTLQWNKKCGFFLQISKQIDWQMFFMEFKYYLLSVCIGTHSISFNSIIVITYNIVLILLNGSASFVRSAKPTWNSKFTSVNKRVADNVHLLLKKSAWRMRSKQRPQCPLATAKIIYQGYILKSKTKLSYWVIKHKYSVNDYQNIFKLTSHTPCKSCFSYWRDTFLRIIKTQKLSCEL